MSAMIRAWNLTRRFGNLTAVDGIDIEIPKGEVFGLVGPDGAGKTTTLRMLCGLIAPTGGGAEIAGIDVARSPDAVKDRIGYMAQRFGLYGDLSVEENMIFYADLFGVTGAERDRLMEQLLRMTRMDRFRSRPAAKLSGGMKQKLALMCTLLHHQDVLFLDEPTNGVDPVSRRDFWLILHGLVKGGLTVLVTTAYLDEAERCDRVALMHRGRLIRCESPKALREGMEETCYAVRSADNRAARDVLRREPGVVSAEPFGSALHVFLDRARAPVEELKRKMVHAGAGEAEFRPVAPSLEDVFIALIRKAGAHGGN